MPRNKHKQKRNWEHVAVVHWLFHWVVALDEDDSNSDPFAGIDEDEDVDLLYADSFKQQQAEIDSESYENLFGDHNSKDFYGF